MSEELLYIYAWIDEFSLSMIPVVFHGYLYGYGHRAVRLLLTGYVCGVALQPGPRAAVLGYVRHVSAYIHIPIF
jgi:hypothetical protein